MPRRRDPLTFAEFRERFHDEAKCRAWLGKARWPNGPVCPRCGSVDRASYISTRPGRYTCLVCRHRFSVTSGTAMHGTKVPLCDWLLVMYLFATSSKGVSANKLSQWLDTQYRTVWHLCHRVRAMMAEEPGWLKGVVEVDETYIGDKPRPKNREGDDDPKPPSDASTGRGTKRPMVGVAVERKAKIAPLTSHAAQHLAPFVWKPGKPR